LKKLLGLGRGLESLIPKSVAVHKTTPRQADSVYYIEVHQIRPNSSQPRTEFDKEALADLADSIKKYGILQPLLVSKVESESENGVNVSYELVAGERRWRAAKLAGLPQVPVIIKENFDKEKIKLEVALVENLQREDLNPLEEAYAYQRLASEFKLTQKEVAGRVGKSREVVANAIRLMGLSPEIKEGIRSGKVSRSQARALLAFDDKNVQKEMFQQILTGKLAVREMERTAKEFKNKASDTYTKRFEELEKNLAENVGSAVMIRSGSNGGSIVIKFSDLEDLNKIVKTILG